MRGLLELNVNYKISVELKEYESHLNNLELNEYIEKKTAKQLLLCSEIKDVIVDGDKTWNERKDLEKYFSRYDPKTECIKVKYSKRRNKWGRSYTDIGLTMIRKEIRNTLVRNIYYDFDIKKCQQSILMKVCKLLQISCPKIEQYVNDGDSICEKIGIDYSTSNGIAKRLINTICFGGTLGNWKRMYNLTGPDEIQYITELGFEIKRIGEVIKCHNKSLYEIARKIKEAKGSQNYLGSFLSYYLQEQELRIVETILCHCYKRGVLGDKLIATYEYDGIKLLKSEVDKYGLGKLLTEINMISEVEWVVKEYTEYFDVSKIIVDDSPLTILELNGKQKKQFEIEKQKQQLLDEGCEFIQKKDDFKAGQILYNQFKDQIIYSNNQYYYYTNNIWEKKSEKEIDTVLRTMNNIKIFVETKNGLENYSSSISSMNLCIVVCKDLIKTLNRNDEFIKELFVSNSQHLFFNNGIYSFTDKKFYTFEEKPDIKSTLKLSYNYPDTNQDFTNEKNSIYEKLLRKLFINEDELNYFLYQLQLVFTGSPHDKKWFALIGNRDCGKSVLAYVFILVFEKYVCCINSNNLYSTDDARGDQERLNWWMNVLQYTRLCILSEIKPNKKLDGVKIKMIGSGGDEIKMRNLNSDIVSINPIAKLMFLSNEEIITDPIDALETATIFNMKSKFVSTITEDHKKINGIGEFMFFEKDDTVKPLFNTDKMKQAFILIILNATKTNIPTIIKEERELIEELDEDKVFKKYFQITWNKEDKVKSTIISSQMNWSSQKTKKIVTRMGGVYFNDKSGSYYTNIKQVETTKENDKPKGKSKNNANENDVEYIEDEIVETPI